MKQKITLSGLLAFAHLLVCILSGAAGWDKQTVIVPLAGILTIVIANRKIGLGLVAASLTVLPFYLLYIGATILLKAEPDTYPIWFFGLLACMLTIVLLHFRVRAVWSVAVLSLLILGDGLFAWPNYAASLHAEPDPARRNLADLPLTNSEGMPVPLESLKGKVVLFDLWSTSCYNCIRKFPELNKLYERYRNDSNVQIIALHLPETRDKQVDFKRFTKPYQFGNLYVTDTAAARKFMDNGLPFMLIMDKKMQTRYAGQLYTAWNIFTGNAWRIINKLKNE